MLDTAPLANYLGLFALGFYIITLLPTILRIVFPRSKKNRYTYQLSVISYQSF